jgi:PTS system nitrogen regulatory IIA component
MKICDILPPSAVICDLSGSSAQDALAELSQPLAARSGLETEIVLAALRSREELGSTGLGDGFAIPHARVPGITGLVTSFGRSRAGIDFRAMDGKPTHFFFALCAPDGAPSQHLNALARISRIFKAPSIRESLLGARDAAEIYRLIEAEDSRA